MNEYYEHDESATEAEKGSAISWRLVRPRPATLFLDVFLSSSVAVLVLWACCATAALAFGHTERLEWILYIAGSITVFLGLCACVMWFREHSVSEAARRNVLRASLAATVAAVCALLSIGAMPVAHAPFIALATLPCVASIRERGKGTAFGALPVLLANSLGLIAVLSFFAFDAEAAQRQTYSWAIYGVWAAAVLLAVARTKPWLPGETGNGSCAHLPQSAKRFTWRRVMWIAAGVLLVCALHMHMFDYRHSRNYVGAMFDVLHGKSLLYDTPSFYGYLNIHILARVFGPLGLSFPLFNFANNVFLALWLLTAAYLLLKVWPWRRSGVLFFVLVVLMQVLFATDNYYPRYSTGPLRFGLSMVICWALVCRQWRTAFWVGTVVSAIAVFWSGEVAVYVAPAWLFVCVADAMNSTAGFWRWTGRALLRVSAFAVLATAIGFGIYLAEYRPGQGFPLPAALFQYAIHLPSGGAAGVLITSMLMNGYGNHYFLAIVAVLGLGLCLAMTANRVQSRMFRPLAFLAIHNVAVFSYFVGHSDQEYAFDIVAFTLIEFALVYRILYEDLALGRTLLRRYFGLPSIVFCILLVLRPVCFPMLAAVEGIVAFRGAQEAYDGLIKRDSGVPLLVRLAVEHQLDMRHTAIICERDDTKLLLDAGLVNELPLNPFYNLVALPDGMDRFLEPAIARMAPGAILLVDRGYLDRTAEDSWWEDVPARDILRRIEKRFSLEKICDIRDEQAGFKARTIDPEWVDLAVFRLNEIETSTSNQAVQPRYRETEEGIRPASVPLGPVKP